MSAQPRDRARALSRACRLGLAVCVFGVTVSASASIAGGATRGKDGPLTLTQRFPLSPTRTTPTRPATTPTAPVTTPTATATTRTPATTAPSRSSTARRAAKTGHGLPLLWLLVPIAIGVLLLVAAAVHFSRGSRGRATRAPEPLDGRSDAQPPENAPPEPDAGDLGGEMASRGSEALDAFSRGRTLEQQGNLAGAEAAYRAAARHGHPAADLTLSRLAEPRADVPVAAVVQAAVEAPAPQSSEQEQQLLSDEAYRRALRDGQSAVALYLGTLLVEEGNLEGAEALYRRADEGGRR